MKQKESNVYANTLHSVHTHAQKACAYVLT